MRATSATQPPAHKESGVLSSLHPFCFPNTPSQESSGADFKLHRVFNKQHKQLQRFKLRLFGSLLIRSELLTQRLSSSAHGIDRIAAFVIPCHVRCQNISVSQ